MTETMADILEEDDMDPGMGESQELGAEQVEETGETTDVQDPTQDILDVLTSKTPNKSLEQYQDNPLDVDGKESTHRILRGLEGLFGELSYALLDIGIGFYQKMGELGGGQDQDDGWTELGGVPDAGNP